MSHLNPQTMGTIGAAAIGGVAAIYTAVSNRRSTTKAAVTTAEAQDRESQREYAMDLLKTLAAEVKELNIRVDELRKRLTTAENATDEERAKRRAVERELRDLQETVERLKALMASLPGAMENAEVRRILNGQA